LKPELIFSVEHKRRYSGGKNLSVVLDPIEFHYIDKKNSSSKKKKKKKQFFKKEKKKVIQV